MYSEKSFSIRRRWKSIWLAIGFLLLVTFGASLARVQESPDAVKEKQVRLKAELHKIPGKVIGEGDNTYYSSLFPVVKYVVEELDLAEPVQAELRGQEVEVQKAWRITVIGGPFEVRALPTTLRIDKTTLVGAESPQLDKITFIVFDRSLLTEGATLTLSHGGLGGVELTDKLNLRDPKKEGRQ